ncbi:MAG TPA: hypothetical protein VE801_02525, partial [Xanthobacteraceae bacterium]|nr:hypothetical protein [Xanthobacteraceae bacterium]
MSISDDSFRVEGSGLFSFLTDANDDNVPVKAFGTVGYAPNVGVLGFSGIEADPEGLIAMESPELWFEDFGTAKLKRGRAVVKLDANFASVIKRGDYRVFVTPEGDCRGLYVRGKRAASF